MVDFDDALECYDPFSAWMFLALMMILAGAWVVWWAWRRFQSTSEQQGAVVASCGLSGRAVARRLLDACGLRDVGVTRGSTQDRYDSKTRTVELSTENYQSAGMTAVAVAAHEVGHARQHASGMLVCRLAPLVRHVCWLLMVAGCVLMALGLTCISLQMAGWGVLVIGILSLTLQSMVVMLRETDATQRARVLVQETGLVTTTDELSRLDRVLRAASLTYITHLAYRWLGFVVVAVALIWIGSSDALLGEEMVVDQCTPNTDAEVLERLRQADAFARSMAETGGSGSYPMESATDGELPGVSAADVGDLQQIPGTVPRVEISITETILFLLIDWSSLILLIGLFVFFGWLQKKCTAPREAVKRNQSGLDLLRRGKHEASIRHFTKAIKLDSKLSAAYCNRGAAHRQLHQLEEARSDFDRAVRLNPSLIDALLGRGEVCVQLGDEEQALADFNEAIRLAPESAAALALRGAVFLNRQQFEQALEDFEEAIVYDDNEALAHWGKGVVLMSQEDYLSAIPSFTTAWACNPEFAAAVRDRGLAQYFLGDHDRAAEDLDEAIRLQPSDAMAWNNRGAVQLKLGRYEGAVNDLRESIRIDPTFPNPYKHLAWLQATCPEPDFRDARQAVTNATRALELCEWKQAEWFAVLAAAHAESGDYESALKWIQECRDRSSLESQADFGSQLEAYRAGRPFRDVPDEAAVATTPS